MPQVSIYTDKSFKNCLDVTTIGFTACNKTIYQLGKRCVMFLLFGIWNWKKTNSFFYSFYSYLFAASSSISVLRKVINTIGDHLGCYWKYLWRQHNSRDMVTCLLHALKYKHLLFGFFFFIGSFCGVDFFFFLFACFHLGFFKHFYFRFNLISFICKSGTLKWLNTQTTGV